MSECKHDFADGALSVCTKCGMLWRDAILPHRRLASDMTTRERFAMAALAGMCADPSSRGTFASYAAEAVEFADALLAALEGK